MDVEIATNMDITKEEEMKNKARWAADTLISAEQFKKDKELKPYLKSELKAREKAVQGAMGKEKPAPAKKVVRKKK